MNDEDLSLPEAGDLGPSHLGRRLGQAWSEGITAFAVVGAISAFLLQPLIRFMDALALEAAALGIMLGGAGLYAMLVLRRGIWAALFGALPIIFGAIIFLYQLNSAATASRVNDFRCKLLQTDMLADQPARSNAADAFAALGCRPQGDGDISAPVTDRERKAGRLLPNGGYGPAHP